MHIVHSFLDWFNLEETFQLIILAALLTYIGGQLMRPDAETYRMSGRIAAAAFLLYAGLGTYAWGPVDASELLIIVFRALLAAGVIFGLMLVTLPPTCAVVRHLRILVPRLQSQNHSEPSLYSPPPRTEPPHHREAEPKSEQETMAAINDARTEAQRYYDQHAELLKDLLPPELFKSQLQTSFPAGVSAEQAWMAARQLIADMLPLVAQGREQRRTADGEARKQAEQTLEEERKRKQEDEQRNAFQKLAEWYQREQQVIRAQLPEGPDREDALLQLSNRYDKLMKETYAEMKP